MSPVLDYIFSHAQVSKKNVLVTILIVRLSSFFTEANLITVHPAQSHVDGQ